MKAGDKKLTSLKHAISLYAFLLVTWGFYRLLFFQLPEAVEVLFLKPLIWLIPMFILVGKDGLSLKEIGLSSDKLFQTIYFVLALGMVFALFGFGSNFLKYGEFRFAANIGDTPFLASFVLSFATAFSEELVFRGYIFTRFWQVLESEWTANIITSLGWALIHAPVAIFDWQLPASELVSYLLVVFIFSVGASFIFARTKNVLAPTFLHVLWQWPIILFR